MKQNSLLPLLKNNFKGLRGKKWHRSPRFWLAVALGLLLLFCLFGPLKILFHQDLLVQYLRDNQCCVIVPFILVYAVVTVIGVPGTILTVAGGVVFGVVWGTVWSVLGATIGAVGAFWSARYLLHHWIEKRFGRHSALVKFKGAVKDKPFAFVLAVRFAPISPFNVVNFLFGLTPIHWVPYSLGTLIGIIPGTLAYTWLGTSGLEALEGGNKFSFFLALGFLALLSIMPFLVKKR